MIILVLAALGVARLLRGSPGAGPPECRVAVGSVAYYFDLEQAANVTTIAAVGKRMGLPDHAVTVAVATALQESGLRNLTQGDRDSLGLFQQRPSQGWGTPSQILTPSYAAAAFYQHLITVPGWETLPVTDAAQRVQRSGSPSAYARWESEARVVARVTTGEVPAGLSCRAPIQSVPPSAALQQAMAQELGTPTLGVALDSARGWTVATWLVGHASPFGIRSVVYGGQIWTPDAEQWQQHPPVDFQVRIGA
ncbi:MAG TPA: hypothetical protein VLV81_10120 [Acidimicrobiia bacterium]|nr:hypothetical protein [Acidimicrobiia bacterium]